MNVLTGYGATLHAWERSGHKDMPIWAKAGSGVSSLLGYTLFSHFSDNAIAATTAVAAGAILAMLADTMIPEAFEEAHGLTGLITVAGFLAAFALSKMAN